MRHPPLFAALLLACAVGAAAAQEVRVYRATDAVDPREVAAILDARPVKFRSIRLLDDTAAPHLAPQLASPHAPATKVAAAAPRSLSLPVQFAFDSAEIVPPARAQLDALAEGIRMLPEDRLVAIEGHTDALGDDDYNYRLSMRRAVAVKRYLVAQHGIDAARLRPIGMGEHATLPGRDPHAPENRRVQFRGE